MRRIIGTLEEESPELAGTVRCYTKRQEGKRKRETLDADADVDGEGGRPRKRIRTKGPESMLAAIASWHTHYISVLNDYSTLTTFPTPPHWPCTKHGCAERHSALPQGLANTILRLV